MIWAAFAFIGAGLLVLRNALQKGLVAQIGTLGATQVRFLYGLPFAALFLALALGTSGQSLPAFNTISFGWTFFGAVMQIAGTGLMLYVMQSNSFAISTAWLKGEPIIIALFGWMILGETLGWQMMLAIGVAVVGVLVMSWPKGQSRQGAMQWQGAALGLLAGTLFGLAAIGFRGAITSLQSGDFLIRSMMILVASQALQSALLLGYMLPFDRRGLWGSLRAWRSSVPAGLLGASASGCLFIAFSLASTALVRTVVLSEVIFALAMARFYFRQSISPQQMLGIAILMAGVIGLLWQS